MATSRPIVPEIPRRQLMGLTKNYFGGPPLTQVNGKPIRPPNSAKDTKVASSLTPTVAMNGDDDLRHDPITAPPESTDDEVENAFQGGDQDSDEDYKRRQTADIRKITFNKATLPKPANTRLNQPKIRVPKAKTNTSHPSEIEKPSSLAGSKRPAEEDQLDEVKQPRKDLEAPLKKKKKLRATYGASSKTTRQNALSIASTGDAKSSAPPSPVMNSFKQASSISPVKLASPRRPFKSIRQSSDSDDLEDSRPTFKEVPKHGMSPVSTSEKPCFKHTSPADKSEHKRLPKSNRWLLRRKSAKLRNPPSPSPIKEESFQRPVFKMPELEGIESLGDNDFLDAGEAPGSQETAWDDSEIEETESTNIARCPICHVQVDRELLEKHSTRGKMSIKQQTNFCRVHKRKSAADMGTDRGYPKIDWEILAGRCGTYQAFLQNILEGTQASYYRNVMKEKVESGKNRTLLTNNDNFTPGYYGPRGLQVMTEFIMRTLSPVIRRRAVEDKLISARSYTGYVQMVLVPELAVRLIMEDMTVTEERARDILDESAEIGELLHDEVL